MTAPTAPMAPTGAIPPTGLLLYDGECGFCVAAMRWGRRFARSPARTRPWQEANLAELGVAEEDCRQAVQWLSPSGRSAGAAAVRDYLASGRTVSRLVATATINRCTAPLAEATYRLIARHRHRLPPHTCRGDARGQVDRSADNAARADGRIQ